MVSIPLWVILLRRAERRARSPRAAIGAVLVGFGGVALLLRPGEQSGDATFLGLLACVIARGVMWAERLVRLPAHCSCPRDPLVSTGWQMLLGGLVDPRRRARVAARPAT